MFAAYCFEHVYPGFQGHIMSKQTWSNCFIWQQIVSEIPDDDEIHAYFVELQHAGFDCIVAIRPGVYWIAYRYEPRCSGTLVVRHTVRVWSSVTDTRVIPLIPASGSPVPRPQWYE